MKIQCPAKVNLYLNTLHKMEDGFHEIESIFHTVGLSDYLSIKKVESHKNHINITYSPDSTIPLQTSDYDLQKGNIIETIYNNLSAAFPLPSIEVEITKHIPVGAGLGGGSSNATGFLHGIRELFQLPLTDREFEILVAQYGSDNPFFVKGGMAFVTGRGEIIESCPYALEGNIVLIYPSLHISTPHAYSHNNLISTQLKESKRQTIPDYPQLKQSLLQLNDGESNTRERNRRASSLLAANSYNSFEEKTRLHYLEIEEIFQKLKAFSTTTLLSGSGSTLFAAYHDNITHNRIIESFEGRLKYLFSTHFTSQAVRVVS